MSERCHLSGLPIDVDAPVIILPVSFGAVVEPALCYQTEGNVSAFAMPIVGQLSDNYGAVTVKGVAVETLRRHIEKNLADNNRNCAIGPKPNVLFDPSRNYAAVRRDGYDEVQRGEFCSDSELLKLHMEPNSATKRYPLKQVDAAQLMDLLKLGALSYLTAGNVKRITYIMISKTFFDDLVSAHYQAELDKAKQVLMDLAINAPQYQQEKSMRDISSWLHFCVATAFYTQMQFNNNHQPEDAMFGPFKKVVEVYHLVKGTDEETKALSALTEWVEIMATFYMLIGVYTALGKSFYPQVSRCNNERQNQFTAFLYAQQEKRRQSLRAEYSTDNGYDDETQDRCQWY